MTRLVAIRYGFWDTAINVLEAGFWPTAKR